MVADGSGAMSYVASVGADHPVVYLRLDETMGMLAVDRSGLGNDATYMTIGAGMIGYATPGALRSDPDPAVALNGAGSLGTGDQAQIQLPGAFNPFTGDFTVEVWVNPRSFPIGGWNEGIFLFEEYLVAGFRIGWSTPGAPALWTNEGGGSSGVTGSTAMMLSAWNYVVVTKAGAQVTIYLQGDVVASSPIVYVTPSTAAENCLGACHGMPTDGSYDELAIYDYALPPDRVAAHYAAGG
jgi:hypothetical protein